jgi:hypothetical protein
VRQRRPRPARDEITAALVEGRVSTACYWLCWTPEPRRYALARADRGRSRCADGDGRACSRRPNLDREAARPRHPPRQRGRGNPRGEYGSDRDSWVTTYEGGGPDINPILSGWKKYDVYDEMVFTDSTVKALVWMERLPIRGAGYELDPASEDGVDLLVRDMVARNLGLAEWEGRGRLAQSWPKVCDQGLLALRWGCMFEEKVWGDVETWIFDGESRLVRPLDAGSRRGRRRRSSVSTSTTAARRC